MVAALELYLDVDATRRVRTLWRALESEGIPTLASLHERHRPHVSLAAARTLAPDAVRRCLEILPLRATVTGAAVTDHANDLARPRSGGGELLHSDTG